MNIATPYSAIPDPDALGRMPRDLTFHPCGTPSPQVLSLQQIEQFNERVT
jgi:hypothetical protein